MPLLHMETDATQAVGQQLQQTASTLQQQSQQLVYVLQNLNGEWQGASAAVFTGEMQLLLQQLNQLANNGQTLNQRLQREVDEWEQVAVEFGTGISGLLTSEDMWISGTGDLFNSIQHKLAWLADHSKWAELGLGLYGFSGLHFVLGSSYSGQVLVYGSRWSKDLAGVSGHLTHLQGSGMSTHLLRQAGQVTKIDAAFAFLQIIPQWMDNYHEYGDDPTKFAVANFVDTLAVAGVGLGAMYVGGAVGAKAGAVVGFAVGGPAGAAAGAVVGGIAGKFAASWMAEKWITEPFLESDLRHDIIDQGTELVKDAGSAMKNNFDDAIIAIQDIRLPEFKFAW